MFSTRFKNEDLIFTDPNSETSYFEINSASLDDTGYYRCRPSNDVGAVYSRTSAVLVKSEYHILPLSEKNRPTLWFSCF